MIHGQSRREKRFSAAFVGFSSVAAEPGATDAQGHTDQGGRPEGEGYKQRDIAVEQEGVLPVRQVECRQEAKGRRNGSFIDLNGHKPVGQALETSSIRPVSVRQQAARNQPFQGR